MKKYLFAFAVFIFMFSFSGLKMKVVASSNPENLCLFDIDDNGIIDIEDLASVGRYYNAVNGTMDFNNDGVVDIYDLVKLSKVFGMSYDNIARFSDSRLEGVVRNKINKTTGTLTKREVGNITSLDADDKGIQDITGIANLNNLEELELRNNIISDISELSSLNKLNTLTLSNNPIANFNPIANKLDNLVYKDFTALIPVVTNDNYIYIDIVKNQNFELPNKVRVFPLETWFDGIYGIEEVKWDDQQTLSSIPGNYNYYGTTMKTNRRVNMKLTVEDTPTLEAQEKAYGIHNSGTGYIDISLMSVPDAVDYTVGIFNGSFYEYYNTKGSTFWTTKDKRIFPIPGSISINHRYSFCKDGEGRDFSDDPSLLYQAAYLDTHNADYLNNAAYFVKISALDAGGKIIASSRLLTPLIPDSSSPGAVNVPSFQYNSEKNAFLVSFLPSSDYPLVNNSDNGKYHVRLWKYTGNSVDTLVDELDTFNNTAMFSKDIEIGKIYYVDVAAWDNEGNSTSVLPTRSSMAVAR
jgi:hypothetical protein